MSTLAAYRSDTPGIGGLTYLSCVEYPGPLTFDVRSGATYYVQAADWLAFGWVRNVDFAFTPDTTPPVPTITGVASPYVVDAAHLHHRLRDRPGRPGARHGVHPCRP